MSTKTMWLISEKIIYTQTTGKNTIDDMKLLLDQIAELLDLTDAPFVHLIIDGTLAQMPQMSVTEIKELFSDLPNTGEIGWTVVVTPSPFLRFLGTLAMQFGKMRSRQVATVDDGLRFLTENDESLPKLDELRQLFDGLEVLQ